MIAGGYLKNFSFLSFFYIFNYLRNKNINVSFLIFIIVIHLSAILMAGNRALWTSTTPKNETTKATYQNPLWSTNRLTKTLNYNYIPVRKRY